MSDDSAATSSVAATTTAPSPADPVPAEYDFLCEVCGYSLLGLMHTKVCPECGKPFNPNALPLARVPWLYRIKLGAVDAYVQTVKVILKDPHAFAAELCRPTRISKRDARLFRSVTGWIAAGSAFVLMLGFTVILWMNRAREGQAALAIAFGVLVGMRFFAHLATDTPTFIWPPPDPSRPHELSPLQHYSCAPLSLIAVPMVFVAITGFFQMFLEAAPIVFPVIAAAIASATSLMLVWRLCQAPVAFMRVATGCSRRRAIALAIYLPIHYVLIAIISYVVGGIAGVTAMVVILGVASLFR